MQLPNPVFAQTLAFGSLAGLQKMYFAVSGATIFGLSLAFLAGASFLTPRCWQDKGSPSGSERLRARFTVWKAGHIHTRSLLGRVWLDRNPFLWLISHQSGVRTSVWFYIALITGVATFLIWDFSRQFDPASVRFTVCIPCAYLLNIGLKVRIGGWASYRLAEARENGALELILSTPIRIKELITGQFLGLRRVFGWPMITIIALLVLGFILSLPGVDLLSGLYYNDSYRIQAALCFSCCLGFLVLDALTLTWCGMWLGLRSKSPGQARSLTMIVCLVAPLLLYPLILPVIDHFPALKPFFREPNFYIVLAFFAGVAALADLAIIWFARRQILRRGRESMQFDSGDSNGPLVALAQTVWSAALDLIGKFNQRKSPSPHKQKL